MPERKLQVTMGQNSAAPSGVLRAKGPTEYRLDYLNGSRGITNLSEELLDDSDWVQVIIKNLYYITSVIPCQS